ncbi:MAG: leucine-rich repeat protein, partial [Bacilli bacterium]
GKLKIYGTQTTKDSAYVVEKVDLTSYQIEDENRVKLFAKRYSDNSLRMEGIGIVPDSIEENLDFTRLVENSRFTEDLLNDINTAIAKDGIGPCDDIGSCFIDSGNWSLSENVSNEIASIINNLDSYHQYNTLYIDEGITRISGAVFEGIVFNYTAFDKIYISKTVNDISSFGSNDYLKEIEFVELKNSGYQVFVDNGLKISNRAFMQCSSLTKVHILDNLSSIGVFAFDDDTNAVIEIEAKKADVIFDNTTEENAFRNVKEVKWLNG